MLNFGAAELKSEPGLYSSKAQIIVTCGEHYWSSAVELIPLRSPLLFKQKSLVVFGRRFYNLIYFFLVNILKTN